MLVALPVAADVGTFSLTDRTEVRVREPDPVTNAAALDVDTLVDARAVYEARRATYTLAYTPRVSALDINAIGLQPTVLHGWTASADWKAGRALITLREVGTYGQLGFDSLSTLSTPGTPVPTGPGGIPLPVANAQPLPAVRTIDVVSSTTTLTSTVALRPWTLQGTVGYQIFGGADPASQQTLPFGEGPLAEGRADARTGRRDHLVTVANAQEASFTPTGTEILLMEAQEQWRHALARTVDTMLGAGVAEVRSRDASLAPYVFTTDPVAEASIEKRFGHGRDAASLSIDLRLAPVVNQLTGLVDERVQGAAIAKWTRDRWTYRATVTAAESTDPSSPTAAKLVTGEVDALYQVSPILSVDFGARALAQDQSFATVTTTGQLGPVTTGSYDQAVVFVALTVRAFQTRF